MNDACGLFPLFARARAQNIKCNTICRSLSEATLPLTLPEAAHCRKQLSKSDTSTSDASMPLRCAAQLPEAAVRGSYSMPV